MKVQSLTGEVVETESPEVSKFYLTVCFEITRYKRRGCRVYAHRPSGTWAVCMENRWYVANTLDLAYSIIDQFTGFEECYTWIGSKQKIDPIVKWKKHEVQMEDCE